MREGERGSNRQDRSRPTGQRRQQLVSAAATCGTVTLESLFPEPLAPPIGWSPDRDDPVCALLAGGSRTRLFEAFLGLEIPELPGSCEAMTALQTWNRPASPRAAAGSSCTHCR